jgi:hypothetical protein
MRFPDGPWVPSLRGALRREPDVVDPTGMHTTTRYGVVPGSDALLVQGLCDLVFFMVVAIADVADNPSWRSGGAIARATWDRLLGERHGDYPDLKAYLGEILAWWHEETTAEVAYAGRPAPLVSQPVLDSLSLLECSENHVVRAVQAKATYGTPRGRVHEALRKFEDLQLGKYDEFWAESIRRFQLELRADAIHTFDPAAVASGRLLLHFCLYVGHRRRATADPAHDYHPRIQADPPHGRAVALFHHEAMNTLVHDVATCIRGRLAT